MHYCSQSHSGVGIVDLYSGCCLPSLCIFHVTWVMPFLWGLFGERFFYMPHFSRQHGNKLLVTASFPERRQVSLFWLFNVSSFGILLVEREGLRQVGDFPSLLLVLGVPAELWYCWLSMRKASSLYITCTIYFHRFSPLEQVDKENWQGTGSSLFHFT